MNVEKIKVRITETGKTVDMVVYSKRADGIQVAIGEGMNRLERRMSFDISVTDRHLFLSFEGATLAGDVTRLELNA